jgi:hypothetical protein
MATQVKKVVAGPLTGLAEAMPGVAFVGPEGVVLGSLTLDALGMTEAAIRALPGIVQRLIVHAISQKVGDSYAGAGDAESPLAFAKQAIAETIKQLIDGDWRVTQPGGIRVSLLARALARATGQTVEAAQGAIDVHSQLDDEGKPSEAGKAFLKNLRAQPAIKAATAAIKLEDAAAAEAKLKAQAAAGGDSSGLAGLFTA